MELFFKLWKDLGSRNKYEVYNFNIYNTDSLEKWINFCVCKKLVKRSRTALPSLILTLSFNFLNSKFSGTWRLHEIYKHFP